MVMQAAKQSIFQRLTLCSAIFRTSHFLLLSSISTLALKLNSIRGLWMDNLHVAVLDQLEHFHLSSSITLFNLLLKLHHHPSPAFTTPLSTQAPQSSQLMCIVNYTSKNSVSHLSTCYLIFCSILPLPGWHAYVTILLSSKILNRKQTLEILNKNTE